MAQLLGVFILLLGVVPLGLHTGRPLLQTSTPKPLQAFAACFANSQERQAQPWAFMPAGKGGTFTNDGASGSPEPYWLQADRAGSRTSLRLFASQSATSVALIEAVNRCR